MQFYSIKSILPKVTFKTFFWLLGLFVCQHANAQQPLQGKVLDSSGHAISNAIIVLKSPKDSSLVNTVFPDTAGVYSMPPHVSFPVLMQVSCLGYKEQYLLLNDTGKVALALNVILARNENQLNEVVIQSAKPLIETKIDRTVFNVSQSITASSGDAMDALKKTPGVSVQNDAIALIGKSVVGVMINDRVLHLSGDDLVNYLRSIPAENISSIEVITTPPAKYDAAGNSGLINIVLKKNQNNGFNGNVKASYSKSKGQIGRLNYGFNYRKDKVNIYADGGITYGYERPTESSSVQYPTQLFLTTDNRKDYRKYLSTNVGLDWQLNKQQSLGILVNSVYGHPDMNENVNSQIYDNNHVLDSTSHTNAARKANYNSTTFNLNYEWKLDSTGKKISVNLNEFLFSNGQTRLYNTQSFFSGGEATYPAAFYKTIGSQKINITTAQIDVDHPTKWAVLSYGGKLTFTHNNSDNSFQSLQDSNYIIDPSRSNNFIYDENVQGLYANAKKESGRWSFQLGLRGEFTQTKGHSVTLNEVTVNKYFKLFPTAYVQYAFNEDNIVNLNYSKRIQRPNYQYLDPFRWYITPFAYAAGNPFLKPSYNNNFEVSYQFKKHYKLTASCQLSNNVIDQATLLDTINNSLEFYRDNIGRSINSGALLNINLTPVSWWQFQMDIAYYYTNFQSAYYGTQVSFGKGSAYTVMQNSFSLNKAKTISAECSAYAQSSYLYGYDIVKPNAEIDLGFKILLMQKNLSINITSDDILATNRSRFYNTQLKTSANNYYDNRNVRIRITYKFGNQNVKEKRERATGIESESGRAH